MALRNFWIDCDIDGRKTSLSGGPRARNGGMEIDIRQRDSNESVKALSIRCGQDYSTGDLYTEVYDAEGILIYEFTTKR